MATSFHRPRPLSADFALHEKQSSMLYSILPSAVQSRLPKFPSFRRSVSMYGLASKRRQDLSRSASGCRTPDMALVLSGTRTDELGYEIDALNSNEDLTSMGLGERQTVELTESKSGIGWKFANQGLNLLSLAVEESSTISADSRYGNPSFSRQLYLHALTYLLRALPQDLTTEEQLSVRSALPHGVVQPLHFSPSSSYPSADPSLNPSNHNQPSLLHRALASTIVQFFILFQFILPYLKTLLSAAYAYEREHKISEKVLSQGIETVDKVGKRSLSITEAIYGLGDGRMGKLIGEAAGWVVEGVAGGIHEGVGEGMVIMGARRPSPSAMERRV